MIIVNFTKMSSSVRYAISNLKPYTKKIEKNMMTRQGKATDLNTQVSLVQNQKCSQ